MKFRKTNIIQEYSLTPAMCFACRLFFCFHLRAKNNLPNRRYYLPDGTDLYKKENGAKALPLSRHSGIILSA
jgi:hypothetical protein